MAASSARRSPSLDALVRKELRRRVLAVIDELPDNDRTVLLQRDIEGLDTAETARILDATPAVVKTRLHRARQALRELLDPEMRSDPRSQRPRGTPAPAKVNHAQRFAYSGVILMGAGSVITGLAIYKPTQLAWLTTLCGGYLFARGLHFALTIGYVAFFAIHIAQVIRAGWNNFQAMVTGYEVVPVEEPPHG
jgi:hypothetical protein